MSKPNEERITDANLKVRATVSSTNLSRIVTGSDIAFQQQHAEIGEGGFPEICLIYVDDGNSRIKLSG